MLSKRAEYHHIEECEVDAIAQVLYIIVVEEELLARVSVGDVLGWSLSS
jgi:hypothetical protein